MSVYTLVLYATKPKFLYVDLFSRGAQGDGSMDKSMGSSGGDQR